MQQIGLQQIYVCTNGDFCFRWLLFGMCSPRKVGDKAVMAPSFCGEKNGCVVFQNWQGENHDHQQVFFRK